jgi:phage FluMu protein Com
MNLNINKSAEARCCCGRLLAVRTADGFEIRCSRCKSVQVLPVGPDEPLHKGDKSC